MGPRRSAPRPAVDLARELAVDELLSDRDVRPRPGPVRCDVDRRARLSALRAFAR